jgi:hypothetical protein
MKISLGLVFAAAVACSSPATEKSTGSNWIACSSDAECSAVPDATCGAEHVCVDRNGVKISKSVLDGGGSGGASATGGQSSTDSGAVTGSGGAGGNGPIGSGGASGQGPGGSGGLDAGAGGAGNEPGIARLDCYSPGQNLDHAYDQGSVGCRCATTLGYCKSGVALVCTNGRWQAVEDGPCMSCWGPDDPDLAANNPSNGCSCTNENETACMFTFASGYMEAKCQGGKWTMTPTTTCNSCTSDKRCGLGGKCVNNLCQPPRCEVNGVRYAAGVGGIAHPLDCNTCTCETDGSLTCSRLPCPTPDQCPVGTTFAAACAECGIAGGCSVTKTGCLPQCQSSTDCTSSHGYCYPNTQVCGVGLCD